MSTGLLPITWSEEEQAHILLDQTRLPRETVYLHYHDAEGVYKAIRDMVVRGAPAIGIAAAYGLYMGIRDFPEENNSDFIGFLFAQAALLEKSRPTAVNLSWALRRIENLALENLEESVSVIKQRIKALVTAMHREDEKICRDIGENLLSLMWDGISLLTHCNAGQLAATRYGTATSPMYLAKERGWKMRVYADETRPRLQGSSLTALELYQAGIDVTVICDNMAATVMSQGKVDAVVVGCDRIAANGDTANKIGTLGVAILAKHFGIPFYVAAPTPSIDMSLASGEQIPIEERSPLEVVCSLGKWTAPENVKVFNPGFDVTPAGLITAVVTEKCVIRHPLAENLKNH